MFGFMVTADGGLTTAGYVITVIAGIILSFFVNYSSLTFLIYSLFFTALF